MVMLIHNSNIKTKHQLFLKLITNNILNSNLHTLKTSKQIILIKNLQKNNDYDIEYIFIIMIY